MQDLTDTQAMGQQLGQLHTGLPHGAVALTPLAPPVPLYGPYNSKEITMTEEVCFDCLPRHEREALDYIIQPDEPFTHHAIMIGGMNPNNVKSKYHEVQNDIA